VHRGILLIALFSVAAAAVAQKPPARAANPVESMYQTLPPAQPPMPQNPAPLVKPIDLRTGAAEATRICMRDVFAPCPDERSKNCFRKEAYLCK